MKNCKNQLNPRTNDNGLRNFDWSHKWKTENERSSSGKLSSITCCLFSKETFHFFCNSPLPGELSSHRSVWPSLIQNTSSHEHFFVQNHFFPPHSCSSHSVLSFFLQATGWIMKKPGQGLLKKTVPSWARSEHFFVYVSVYLVVRSVFQFVCRCCCRPTWTTKKNCSFAAN